MHFTRRFRRRAKSLERRALLVARPHIRERRHVLQRIDLGQRGAYTRSIGRPHRGFSTLAAASTFALRPFCHATALQHVDIRCPSYRTGPHSNTLEPRTHSRSHWQVNRNRTRCGSAHYPAQVRRMVARQRRRPRRVPKGVSRSCLASPSSEDHTRRNRRGLRSG